MLKAGFLTMLLILHSTSTLLSFFKKGRFSEGQTKRKGKNVIICFNVFIISIYEMNRCKFQYVFIGIIK